MSKYTARLTAPAKTDRHYYSNDNAFFRSGFGMPNCTAYAYGRFAEITGKFPKMYGNAEDWWDEAKRQDMRQGRFLNWVLFAYGKQARHIIAQTERVTLLLSNR